VIVKIYWTKQRKGALGPSLSCRDVFSLPLIDCPYSLILAMKNHARVNIGVLKITVNVEKDSDSTPTNSLKLPDSVCEYAREISRILIDLPSEHVSYSVVDASILQ
jgi:hypothetical protein